MTSRPRSVHIPVLVAATAEPRAAPPSGRRPCIEHAAGVAERLAAALAEGGRTYALGGAIALGYWAAPRGTLDVDVTIFLPPDRPLECLWLLQDLGCEVDTAAALASLRDSGFCQVTWGGLRVDVFLPTL